MKGIILNTLSQRHSSLIHRQVELEID
jgi:hypothetical protein